MLVVFFSLSSAHSRTVLCLHQLIQLLTENITFLCPSVKLYKESLRLHPITLTMIRANGVYQLLMSSHSPRNKERQRDVDSEPGSTFTNEGSVPAPLINYLIFSPLYGISLAIQLTNRQICSKAYCGEGFYNSLLSALMEEEEAGVKSKASGPTKQCHRVLPINDLSLQPCVGLPQQACVLINKRVL